MQPFVVIVQQQNASPKYQTIENQTWTNIWTNTENPPKQGTKDLLLHFIGPLSPAHESPWVRRTVESNWLLSLLVGKRWRSEARKSKLCLPLPLAQPQGPLPESRAAQPAKFFHFSSITLWPRWDVECIVICRSTLSVQRWKEYRKWVPKT